MIVTIGSLALLLALGLALAGVVSPALRHGGRPGRFPLGPVAIAGQVGLVTVAALALMAALVTGDFSLKYVATNSSLRTPFYYRVTALWAALEGSLLLWEWLLAAFAGLVLWQHRQRHRELMPWVTAIFSGVSAFFLGVLVFAGNPFERLSPVPLDGRGLNPLLEDADMFTHPPLLYAGFVALTVPYAFAMAALIAGKLDEGWIATTRKWTIAGWLFLTLGNLFGGWWSYHVLGWGGYWAWDPVENASFLPWLPATAFLHSIQIQERRGMLKVWNLGLLLMTFALCIFGTFAVRSGIIASVHAFGQSVVGPYYLGFLAATLLLSVGLLFWRMPRLRSENELDSLLSREASFLLNNLLFLALVFAIFWGTIFPLVSELAQGVKLTVGPPYFNQVAGPLLLALIALMGVAPLMPWRRASPEHLRRAFLPPLGLATLGMLALLAAGVRQPYALVAIFCCLFVLATIGSEFSRGALARHASTGEGYLQALATLVRRNNRRYGGYLVHVGIVAIALAVVGSNFYQLERQSTLRPGESLAIGSYRLTYQRLNEYDQPGRRVVEAQVSLEQDGRALEIIRPSKRYYDNFERQPQSGIIIRSTPLEDLYVVLAGWDSQGAASLLVFVNPMVLWLWLGGLILVFGTFVSLWPEPRPRQAVVPQPAKGVAVGA
ncbi:MAG: heme lyase CcmF/NrfE family subunit [Chloroflexi bacterium]|nr:heme lyase CcmF/NrfE family subunit [Chloroflexota bacterium]